MKKCAISMKKIVSAMAAVLIFMLSVCSYSMNTGAANTSIIYTVYDAKTSNYLRSYRLESLNSWISQRTVIPPDEREIDWSKSGVVKIMSKEGFIGSGFVVGDHVIATAAHCVEDWELTEILLFNNDGSIALHAVPVECHYASNYVYGGETNDYALITVEEDLSDYVQFHLGVMLDNATPEIQVTGFPGDLLNSDTLHTMYTGTGNVINIESDDRLYYDADVSGGNSGGPVYVTETRAGKTYYTVIGIHTHGFTENYTDQYNSGARVTTDLLHFYYNNPYLEW